MNIQSNLYRVASQTPTIKVPNPSIITLPSLWLNLPVERQKQIAQGFARLSLDDAIHRRANSGGSARCERRIDRTNALLPRIAVSSLTFRSASPPWNQVRHHQESTELQYRLVDSAVALGWPHERVLVIDEDLGKSEAGTVERVGFKKLIAEIALGHAGLVIDASRLACNNRDWHQLLDSVRALRRHNCRRRTSLRSLRLP
ncbi:hypothetical protein [Mesorhizobium sp.]|uniref:hypothetical protein n=1 Tax=Mesorhizobium sp. TaxID=1871066 RepID=UPI00257EB1EB|nr:hypothetical protein [Mesorhizobium sp.]